MRTRGFIVALALFFALAGSVSTVRADTGAAGRMGREEINERWQELRQKGWSKAEMGRALQLSRRQAGLFDIIVELKGKAPLPAIQKSFEVCEGKPELVREFWDYVLQQNFSPQEVAQVISNFPPNKQQRWLYFKYRAGGTEALQQRGKKDEEERKRRPETKGYSAKEVMTIFRRVRFDVSLVKEYFSLRQKGVSPQDAWSRVRKTVRDQMEKEKEEARKKKETEETKERERAEAREKLREASEKEREDKADKTGEKEKDKGDIISLEGLSALEKDDDDGSSEEGEKDAPKEEKEDPTAKSDAEEKDTGRDQPEKESKEQEDVEPTD